MKLILASATVCFVLCSAAPPAEAQIYTWRDTSGQLVLSNKPQSAGAASVTTYGVPGVALMRTTTKPANVAKNNRYDDLIHQHAAQFGLSVDLVRAVIQAESGFNPHAVSPKGAMGLMQLMPATARELGVVDPFQPSDNIRGGVTYLAGLMTRYQQNVELALAAYNAGIGNVTRYGRVPPFRETQDYVRKITGAAAQKVTRAGQAVVYKWIELVDGRPNTRYSNVPPKDIAFEVLGKR